MKFSYKPYKHYVIKEISELSQESFTKLFLSLEEHFTIWCKGVLIHLSEFENKPKDKTKSFELFYFAKCAKIPEILDYNGFKLEVIDVSGSKFHRNLVEWLKHTEYWRAENVD